MLRMALLLGVFVFILGLARGEDSVDTFPENFIWGASTVAFTSEGAWNEDGKSPNIWDSISHDPKNPIMNNTGGDVSCDSYHKYKEDVELLKELGVSYYRFSIAWSRLIPNPLTREVYAKGVDFYNRLIDALLEAGIKPMVFLYYWDMPQILQERYQGWAHDIIVDKFGEYADAVFRHFGDRVKWGYGAAFYAPGLSDEHAMYRAAHNQIRSHVKAWHIYNDKYRASQKGQVGLSIGIFWTEPLDPNNPEDVAANERSLILRPGWYTDPIFKNGDYSEMMKEYVGRRSQSLGLSKSLLQEFTEEEKVLNKGTSDFIAFGLYSMNKVTRMNQTAPYRNCTSYFSEDLMDIKFCIDPSWKRSSTVSWYYYTPGAFRNALNWVAKEYGNQPIYVVEHGVPDEIETLHDTLRVKHLQDQLKELLQAIHLDGCDVRGYILFALLDNSPMGSVYPGRFGIYHVDMNHPDRRRTPKMSAEVYRQIVRNNGFAELVPNVSSCTYAPAWKILIMGIFIHYFKIPMY